MTQPLRVAFATPATFDQLRGGGERYPLNMAMGLAAVGNGSVKVTIVGPATTDGRHQLAPGVELLGCRSDVPSAGWGEGLSWKLIAALAEADVVHVHQLFTSIGEGVCLAAKAMALPLVVTYHGGESSSVGRILGLAELADVVMAYSRVGGAAIPTSRPVAVIEGGVNAEFFTPPNIPRPRTYILFAGRIMPHKGVDVLLRACPLYVPVVVAGTAPDPAYLAHLRNLARHRPVRFVFNPSDEALRDLYRGAIAVALPSVHIDLHGRYYRYPELMGLTMLEGMACGAPALCMRTGALPEYVADGVTGFVCDDETTLADRIRSLAQHPARVAEMGAAARRQVASEWDAKVSAERLLRMYKDLVTPECASLS